MIIILQLTSLNLIPVISRPPPDTDMSDIVTTIDRINVANDDINNLREDIKSSFNYFDVTKQEITRQATLVKLELLRKEVEEAEAEAEQEEYALAQEESMLRQTNDLEETISQCQNLTTMIKELNEASKIRAENLAKSQFIFEARQLKLLSELQTIYPIEQVDNGEYAIRGLELPMDTFQKDDEQISSALGYLVHLLLLTSKYLGIFFHYSNNSFIHYYYYCYRRITIALSIIIFCFKIHDKRYNRYCISII